MAELILLTQDDCAFCEQAHGIAERLSTEFDLTVRSVDLASPEGQALAGATGILFAPGVFLDGEPFSYGRLSERKLRRALSRSEGA